MVDVRVMRIWLRYLLLTMFVFSVIAKTGISIDSLFSITTSYQADCMCDVTDDEEAPNGNETKETSLKEYWDIPQPLDFSQILTIKHISYPGTKQSNHLAWVSPVPTPPPNV
jgi:hypothetical protein